MKFKQYIVDAFAKNVFEGNPAAVCILDKWYEDDLLIKIAQENNLSETAFLVQTSNKNELRWFTPKAEIDLCGHATLATAHVVFEKLGYKEQSIIFSTLSGDLEVKKENNIYTMDFPSYTLENKEITKEIENALGVKVVEVLLGRDLLCVLENEDVVRNFEPDLEKIEKLEGLLLHITAQSTNYDCISRTFAPKLNVSEDPVCGSGHCHIFPYWSKKLNKNKLLGYQASKRGGELVGELVNNRVVLGGSAVIFSEGEITI